MHGNSQASKPQSMQTKEEIKSKERWSKNTVGYSLSHGSVSLENYKRGRSLSKMEMMHNLNPGAPKAYM